VEQWGEEEGMKTTILKKNSIQDWVKNEEKEYPVPDLNKTMINVTDEPRNIHKKSLKEEIMDEITKKLMEKIPEMVNQKV
jgi:hypothetical protein